MKIKVLIIIVLLFCYPLISQEFYHGYRIVTWEEIQGFDYIILSEEADVITVEVNGEIFIIENE